MYFKYLLSLLVLIFFEKSITAQKKGCTDMQASNYDASAKINDGSCLYKATAYSPAAVCPKLSDTLIESSGVIFFNNWFWTINDSGNEPSIYAFDSLNGTIIHQTTLTGKTNIDWEEISQDSANIYIGDFGNNTGDRKDLKIYIVKKSDLNLKVKTETVTASEIQFSYADQSSFISANQNHNFDMEAMCILGDSIHLFSKNWVDKRTKHYILPKIIGNYILAPRESIAVDGLITSACSNTTGEKIILGAYNTSNGACLMWMLWDYNSHLVFNGNKRKIDLGSVLTLGQYEATTFKKDELYFTNEKKFTEAGLWRAEINQWFTPASTNALSKLKTGTKFIVYQKENELIIETVNTNGTISVYNSSGQKIISQKIRNEKTLIAIGQLKTGIYSIEVNGNIQKIMIEN